MSGRRVSLLVEVDLDPIPGFGATTESWRAWLHGMLVRAAGHYRPAVTAAPGIAELRGEVEALTVSLHQQDDRTPSAKRSADYWLRMLQECEAERDQLRGEVERLQRRLFPGQGESYTNEVERQRVVIDQMATIAKTATAERDDLRAQLAAAQAQLAEARLVDVIAAALCDQAEQAEASEGEAWWAMSTDDVSAFLAKAVSAALSAAPPRPEPDRRPINARFYPDAEEEPLVMVDVDDEPPASDEQIEARFQQARREANEQR